MADQNARTIKEGEVTFTIIESSHVTIVDREDESEQGNHRFAKVETPNDLIWPPTWNPENTTAEALHVGNGQITLAAKIRAEANSEHRAELERWSAHFYRNVVEADRAAVYEPGNVLVEEKFQNPLPICDKNEQVPKPFIRSNADDPVGFSEIGHKTSITVSLEFDDPPHQKFPVRLDSQTRYRVNSEHHGEPELLNGTVKETRGGINFAAWLVLLRKAKPGVASTEKDDGPCLILVDSIKWRQNFAVVKGQDGAWPEPQQLTCEPVHNIEPMEPIYAYKPPSAEFPDTREGAEGNNEIFFELSYPGANDDQPIRWVTADNEQPTDFKKTDEIKDTPNFLQPEEPEEPKQPEQPSRAWGQISADSSNRSARSQFLGSSRRRV